MSSCESQVEIPRIHRHFCFGFVADLQLSRLHETMREHERLLSRKKTDARCVVLSFFWQYLGEMKWRQASALF